MPESTLSFNLSSSFRDTLLARNLQPYNVPGAYTPPAGNLTYEISPLQDSSVIDSPNDLIGTTVQANNLYALNEYGPEGGYNNIINTNNPPLPVTPNQGEYGQDDAQIDLLNEFYIDTAYIKNIYGPESGYKDLVTLTDNISDLQYFLPYSITNDALFVSAPINFLYSVYSPFEILLSDNPTGSPGSLSQDSFLAQVAAKKLKDAFTERINTEIYQATLGSVGLDALQDPFEASLVATGQQPLITKNWKITVPENPILAAVSFANRLSGTYFPVSFIPGDYFNQQFQIISPQTENALNVVNNLTGGALGPILNKYRNPSELFVANTGYGQKSVLFKSLDYNVYRPKYERGLVLGVTTAISNLLGNSDKGGGYYVGSDQAEPSTINSPANEVPSDRFGRQQETPVYGPAELGQLYEGNIDKIQFGLKGKSISNQGGIAGQFIWTSPKYKDNLGFKVKPGGDPVKIDSEYNSVKGEFNSDTQSDDFDFKGGSILDNTQRLVESADNVTGEKRLKHVGNAINQISKVFNDGYKEMTKGSQVIAYYDSVTNKNTIGIDGTEVGMEYCRVFQKDTPYYTFADLQKTDGITTSGRRFNNSVFDNTYNLNIAPLRGIESTNIRDGKVKKYMFSLENLAWRTSDQPGFTYDELPVCERGPNGGRIMWFPPYALSFSDSSTASWNPTSFLGRPEPIYTYKNTTRSGSLSWMIVVDSPAAMNTIIEKQLANLSEAQVDSIMDSFFAGCVKYDLYDLAAKFNTIPVNQLYTYQELLQSPRLTEEQKYDILNEIPINQTPTINGSDGTAIAGTGNQINVSNSSGTQGNNTTATSDSSEQIETDILKQFEGFGFYFDNDYPTGTGSWETELTSDYKSWYDKYVLRRPTYASSSAPAKVKSGNDQFVKGSVIPFFDDVVIGNFKTITNDLLPKLKEIIIDKEGTVTLELQGSASAPASPSYNVNLSKRRNSVVLNWFRKQTIGDKKISQLETEKKITFTFNSSGEKFIIPQSNKGGGVGVDCTKNIIDVNLGYVTNNSQWYSFPAMVCRRVGINVIKATIKKEKPKLKYKCLSPGQCAQAEDGTFDTEQECLSSGGCQKPVMGWSCIDNVCKEVPNGEFATKELCKCGATSVKRWKCLAPGQKCVPAAETDLVNTYTAETECNEICGNTPPIQVPVPPKVNKEIKEGISKKVLRYLFSECDYFEVIKETNPMIYSSIKDKIKYFSPAFHSTTPEGLNARLTFLQQCVRPGQTIPVIGPDGKPKYNDARNTSFGTPPVLVLRIGDFYHTKIIPNQLSITYEPLVYDINPEGIGIQPMIAKISLGFDFIGGHGLAHPIQTLQNALSFNYYANTEVYDERAESTESTKDKDKDLVSKIISRKGDESLPISNIETNNVVPQKGGSTIGNILSTNLFDNGSYEQGEIEYTEVFKELSDKTNNYFKTIFNQLKTMNEVTNYPMVQLVTKQRRYTAGELAQYDNNKLPTKIFGKSYNVEDRILKLVSKAAKDVKDDTNPIIKKINPNPNHYPDSAIRELKNKLKEIVESRDADLNNDTIGSQNEITKNQEDYIQTFRKLDLVNHKVDGYKLDTGEYKVYTLADSGQTDADVFELILKNYQLKVGNDNKDFLILLTEKYILDQNILIGDDNFYPIYEDEFLTPETSRFYFVMSNIFTDDTKFKSFVESLMTEKVKLNTFMEKDIREVCEQLRVLFVKEFDAEKKLFTDFEKSPEYQKYLNFKIDTFETKLSYTTVKKPEHKDNQKLLKQLYSDFNINNDRETFNDKVTFN